MSEELVKYMVDRFLGWRLPEDFSPDAGISFTRPNYHPSVDARPSGTNLFSAQQAEAMVRYMLEGGPMTNEEAIAASVSGAQATESSVGAVRSFFLPRGPWAHPANRLAVATKIDDHTNTAISFVRLAPDRAKPDASDVRGLTIGLVSMMRAKGALMPGSIGCEQEIDDYFATALAEARRAERERCAQLCDADGLTTLPDERRVFLAHGELPTAAWQARRSAAAIRALPDNA